MITRFHAYAGAIIMLGQVLLACAQGELPAERSGDKDNDFYAYYTKVTSEEPFERFSRTGEQADLVVHFGQQGGQLVFWRGTSYLPYWQTESGKWSLPEIVPRNGDGEGPMPDRVNSYSHVNIIRQQLDEVLIHWRYLPQFSGTNPHRGVDATKFVDELFLLHADGKVTRTIKQGTAKFDRWQDPRNKTTQTLMLTAAGIEVTGQVGLDREIAEAPVKGTPLRSQLVADPIRYWTLDESVGDAATESVTGTGCEIKGHKSLWRKGVSGTALQFDGYNTVLGIPADKAPRIEGALTLEGWVAIGAYPWNWAPIVTQGDEDGYFLGISGHGCPGLKVRVGDRRVELVADMCLDRNRWYHIAGTYDGSTGLLRLFVDGKQVAAMSTAPGAIVAQEAAVQVGKGKNRRPEDPVRENTFVTSYSLDGLIDEVRIYDTTLSPDQVAESYSYLRPEDDVVTHPDMPYRLLPQPRANDRFGAEYTHLKFYPSWDVLWRFGPYPDVVVGFDTSPAKFIFWRGTGYIPMLVNDQQQWYSNEFNETWGRTGGQGCQEPMSDKESYTNYARVLENTDARVVIHWRYPLLDVLHVRANYDEETGWCDYADWYYTIYPDGVAVKRMRLWTHGPRNHEWHEAMAILGPNQHPEQVIDTDPALVLADLDGNVTNYTWIDGPPSNVDYSNKKIHVVKYKGRYSPYTIGDFQGGDVYSGEVTDYSVFPSWNHWPVAQIPSDGRYASFPDRTAHSSLTHVRLPDHRAEQGDRPFQEKLLMEGMTDKPAGELALLAKSWLKAPELEVVEGCRSGGYVQAERAYQLVAENASMSFRVVASEDQPLCNPCFVISHWNCNDPAWLTIDGKESATTTAFRQGVVRDSDGRQKMLIWVELTATQTVTFSVRGAQPQQAGR